MQPLDYERYDSDETGILSYIHAFLDNTEHLLRGTGRTTRALKRLQEGDCFVVHDERYASHIKRELKLANKGKVKVLTMAPDTLIYPQSLHGFSGEVIFDHHWMLEHIKWRLKTLLDFPTAIIRMCRNRNSRTCKSSSLSGPIWPGDMVKAPRRKH